jgi:hypothetical protein
VGKSDIVTAKLLEFFTTTKVPGLDGATISDVLLYLGGNGCKCFPYGGIVRDQFLGNPPKDLDMEVSCSTDTITRLCLNKYKNLKAKVCHGGYIAHIGSYDEPGEVIDASNWANTFFGDGTSLEYTTNALAYSIEDKAIIDLTGQGVDDTCNMKIRIPVDKKNWDKWLKNQRFGGFRYWKLRYKGYDAADADTREYIATTAREQIKNLGQTKSFLRFFCRTFVKGEVGLITKGNFNFVTCKATQAQCKNGRDFYNTIKNDFKSVKADPNFFNGFLKKKIEDSLLCTKVVAEDNYAAKLIKELIEFYLIN